MSCCQPIVIPEPSGDTPAVETVTAGSNVTITGTSTNPIINAAGTVTSISAGSNVTITGTAAVPIINATEASPAPAGAITMYAGNSPFPNGWLLCDGSNVLQSTYSNLYTVIGNIYSQGPALGTTYALAATYSYSGNTITVQSFSGAQANEIINVGSICTVTGTTPTTGSNINSLPILMTSVPAFGTIGNFNGTFVTPLAGTGGGSGGPGDSYTLTRISFQVPDMRGLTVRGVTNSSPYQINQKGGLDEVTLTPQNLPSHAHNIPGDNNNEGVVVWAPEGGGEGDQGNYINTTFPCKVTGAEVLLSDLTTVATATGEAGTPFDVTNAYIALNYIIKT